MAMISGGRTSVYIASVLLFLSGVSYIVANALPMWVHVTLGFGTVDIGLWRGCSKFNMGFIAFSECGNLPPLELREERQVQAARAFVTISCILWALATASLVSTLFVNEKRQKDMSALGKLLARLCLITGIIGLALGIHIAMEVGNIAANKRDDALINQLFKQDASYKIGVSVILAIVAVVLNLAAAIATFFI